MRPVKVFLTLRLVIVTKLVITTGSVGTTQSAEQKRRQNAVFLPRKLKPRGRERRQRSTHYQHKLQS